ncbi:MAG: 3-hydroxyacyl-CoA dehydrogenase family protein [Syntrophomonadaceae bacterium]|nr:3-hydroxyacyl-CoA dehydrogenase family protein [Syntrophomonadaceae bacterium]
MNTPKLLIVGSGTMGSGIAQVAAERGLEVVLYDMKREQIDKALTTINGLLQKKVDKGKLAQDEKDSILARIQAVDSLGEKAAACDFVIEAIFENFAAKVQLFQELDKVCKPEAIIISNTSTLSISKMAEAFRDPTRFMGMHFFSPVPVMRLVEVVRGEKTSDATLAKGMELVAALGKTGVIVKDIPGFLVNRINCLMYNEAARLVEAGVTTAADVDLAMKLGMNHPMGPLEMIDMAGIDVATSALEALYEMTGNEAYKPAGILQQMVKEGRCGRKTGKGFYDYN